ncbi:MAG TPA: hypothetical protein VF203_00860 [Burkholderiales bacterium]
MVLALLWIAGPRNAAGNHVRIKASGSDPEIALVVESPTGTLAVGFDLSGNPQTVGNGAPVAGTPALLVEVGARRGGGPTTPTTVELRADAPAFLLSPGGSQIPISSISWTSTAVGGAVPIPAGQFAAGSQVIATLPLSKGSDLWMGGQLTFYFANAAVYPAGTYSGTISFTATFTP